MPSESICNTGFHPVPVALVYDLQYYWSKPNVTKVDDRSGMDAKGRCFIGYDIIYKIPRARVPLCTSGVFLELVCEQAYICTLLSNTSNIVESNRTCAHHVVTMNKQIIVTLLSLGIVAVCESKELSDLLQDEKFVENVKNCILDKETCDDMGFKVRSKLYFMFIYYIYSVSRARLYIFSIYFFV